MNATEALEEIGAVIKRLSFSEGYHQDTSITVRSDKNLVASWWWDRVGYKPRRWELSIRFPGDLIRRYCGLSPSDRARVAENVRVVVGHQLGNLDVIEEGHIPTPANYICELDDSMFD